MPTTSERVLAAGVSPQQIEDALAVCLAFDITARLANAFDFSDATPAAMNAGAQAPVETRLPIGTVVHLERSPAHQVGRTGATPPSGLAPAAVGGAA